VTALAATGARRAQVLSIRPDVLPPPVMAELAKLQDGIPPFRCPPLLARTCMLPPRSHARPVTVCEAGRRSGDAAVRRPCKVCVHAAGRPRRGACWRPSWGGRWTRCSPSLGSARSRPPRSRRCAGRAGSQGFGLSALHCSATDRHGRSGRAPGGAGSMRPLPRCPGCLEWRMLAASQCRPCTFHAEPPCGACASPHRSRSHAPSGGGRAAPRCTGRGCGRRGRRWRSRCSGRARCPPSPRRAPSLAFDRGTPSDLPCVCGIVLLRTYPLPVNFMRCTSCVLLHETRSFNMLQRRRSALLSVHRAGRKFHV